MGIPSSRPALTPLRALVLDDESLARNYLAQLIEATQLAQVVGTAANIAEACDVLARLSVDVVFVDVQLSGAESGLDFIRRLVSCRPEARRPAFVLATALRQAAPEGRELGAVDCLLKPFSEERVEQCLKGLLARKTA